MSKEKTVFIVLEHTGAHDPAPVWSIWTTREGAEGHAQRLRDAEGSTAFGSSYEVKEVSIDVPLDTWAN